MLPPQRTHKPTIVSTPAPKTYKDMVVGLVQPGSESDWRTANVISFKETAQELGITLIMDNGMFVGRDQVGTFRQAIRMKVDVIVLAARDPAGWDDPLKEAREAGIVVIVEDRPIDAPEDLYATYISTDLVKEGRKAGREMCKLLDGSVKKNVWELAGTVGSMAAVDRGKGFHETAGECGITITHSQTGNFTKKEGKTTMETFLKNNKDVQGIFAHNDDMALGAIEALKEAGLKPGIDIKIVSIDAKADAFKAMLAGELNVSVECNPLFAPQVYAAALAAMNGKTLPKWIPVNEGVFRSTDENLEEVLKTRRY
jgi:simple sugar transport system substrate-binding protein